MAAAAAAAAVVVVVVFSTVKMVSWILTACTTRTTTTARRRRAATLIYRRHWIDPWERVLPRRRAGLSGSGCWRRRFLAGRAEVEGGRARIGQGGPGRRRRPWTASLNATRTGGRVPRGWGGGHCTVGWAIRRIIRWVAVTEGVGGMGVTGVAGRGVVHDQPRPPLALRRCLHTTLVKEASCNIYLTIHNNT